MIVKIQLIPKSNLSGGLQFQVQFVNKEYIEQQELRQELQQERTNPTLYSKVLNIIAGTSLSRKEISIALKRPSISGQLNTIISALQQDGLIEWTIPEVPPQWYIRCELVLTEIVAN